MAIRNIFVCTGQNSQNMPKLGKSSLQSLEHHKLLARQDQRCLVMTSKNESLLSDTPHDGTQGYSQSSASSPSAEGKINQALLPASAVPRPVRTRDTASHIHKSPRLEISNSNDKGKLPNHPSTTLNIV